MKKYNALDFYMVFLSLVASFALGFTFGGIYFEDKNKQIVVQTEEERDCIKQVIEGGAIEDTCNRMLRKM
jgi:hypothetical protein